jgi:hypothetical protein
MIVGKFLHRSFSRGWGAGGWRSASEGLVGVRGQKPSCNCTAIDVAGEKKKKQQQQHFNKVESSCYVLHNIVQFMHL